MRRQPAQAHTGEGGVGVQHPEWLSVSIPAAVPPCAAHCPGGSGVYSPRPLPAPCSSAVQGCAQAAGGDARTTRPSLCSRRLMLLCGPDIPGP